MPIYEYECQSCHNLLESWQSFKDEPLTTCPDCSGSLKKVISATSFTLKGGGWYADGYSSKATNGASCKSAGCAASTSSCAASDSSKTSSAPCAASSTTNDSKSNSCAASSSCGCT